MGAKEKIAEAKAQVAKKKEQAKATLAKMKRPSSVEMPDPTGNPEIDSVADLDAVQKGFRDRIKQENNRFELATDTEYWTCLCFQTREQKEAFLKALELFEQGDKYLDGREVANRLNVELPDADVPYRSEGKIDKDFAAFV